MVCKEELIRDFIEQHTPGNDVHAQWQDIVRENQKKERDGMRVRTITINKTERSF